MLKKHIKRALAIVPPQYRQSLTYYNTKRWLERSKNWPTHQLNKARLIKLRRLIYLAYNNTAGYRQLYKQAGVQPSDIQKLSDLRLLPVVNKEILSENIKDFSVQGSGHKYNSTGGTTGQPFGFYLNRGIFAKEAAFMHSQWNHWGWKLGDRSVVLRGAFIGSQQKVYDYHSYTRELFFSAHHLEKNNLNDYIQAYQKYGSPSYLQAYPSALSLLCDLIMERGQNPFFFKVIFLGSENIYSWQLEKFKAVFPQLKIHSWYGHAEKACLAHLIPDSNLKYEIHPLYGIAEPGVTNENGMQEIIATGFINTSTPFIRYQTNDFAKFGEGSHPNLSYEGSTVFEKIDGRLQEVIITKSKKYISMTSMSIHQGLFDNLKQFQFHQTKPGEVTLNIVPQVNLDSIALKKIQSSLTKKFNNDLSFQVNVVENIKKTQRGKMRYLIQDLDIKYHMNSETSTQ